MEMVGVCALIDFMKDLKALGHSTKEIKSFLEEQFSRVKGSINQPTTGNKLEDHHDEHDN